MLSTKNIKGTGASIPKTLQPGNQLCKINSVSLEDFKWKPGACHLILSMEGPDLGKDFDGFNINKDKPELGKHKGQVGNVKATQWAFADGETKSKIPVVRDEEIMKFMNNLCTALEIKPWLDAQDNKHETIESLIRKFNEDAPYKDVILNCCLAGKEYQNKGGYLNYELFLPKYSKTGVPFESIKTKISKVQKFNEAEHIVKKKVETVGEFGGAAPEGPSFTV